MIFHIFTSINYAGTKSGAKMCEEKNRRLRKIEVGVAETRGEYLTVLL